MGFKIQQRGDSGCVITAFQGGNDSGDFLLCVQTALKQLWLEVLVDVSEYPAALGSALPYLLKLQKVLESHHLAVTVQGLKAKVPEDYLSRIKGFGIIVAEDILSGPEAHQNLTHNIIQPEPVIDLGLSPPGDPALAATTPLASADTATAAAASGIPGTITVESTETVALRLEDLRKRMKEAIVKRRDLEQERKAYKDRMKVLSKGQEHWQVDSEKISSLSQTEAHLIQLRGQRALKNKEVEKAQEALKAEQAAIKAKNADESAEHKKKKDVLDKKLGDLQKKLDKIRADFKKKSDSRKEKLQRMQAKK